MNIEIKNATNMLAGFIVRKPFAHYNVSTGLTTILDYVLLNGFILDPNVARVLQQLITSPSVLRGIDENRLRDAIYALIKSQIRRDDY
jgi:hypothetical protein